MLMLNIILAVSFVPIWPILYFMIRYYAKPMKNIILGVTLPQSVHDDDNVQEIVQGFKKWLNITMLPLLLLVFVPFFMTSMGAAMTWFMVWMVLIIVLPFAVFGVHREKLMTLKRENNWYGEATGKALTDIKAAAMPPRRLGNIWFLPPVAISLFPVVYILSTSADWAMASVYITFAATTILFWVLYPLIFRLRSEVVNEDLTLTMALTRVRRYNWGKFWLVATWSTGLLNLLLWFFESNAMAFLYLTLGYTLVILVIAIRTEFMTRKAQHQLTTGDIGELYLDEDDYWIWGMLYHNPNDEHFMVNYRVGIGMGVNLAKLSAKILMGFAALTIVAMPFLGVWMWVEETTPVHLVLNETELIAKHTGKGYVIPLRDIESIELTDEMPYLIARTNGTSYDNLNKGKFSVRGYYGSVILCVYRKDPPFLIIEANGQAYIINDVDSNVTRGIYAQIIK